MTLRTIRLAALLGSLACASGALAADGPALRGDVTANRDTLALGDLVDNVPADQARTPLFRAPALGQSGTIQARRIVDAAEALGIRGVETGGRAQVTITRAARTVGATEIDAAIRRVLAHDQGIDPVATAIVFDGTVPPSMAVGPENATEAVASDVTLDRRSRRVGATVWIGPSSAVRRGQIRVTGVLVETVEVSVVARPIERGGTVAAGDLTSERRPRDLVPPDVATEGGAGLVGRVARKGLGIGALVRASDLTRPEAVGRGDLVNVVYEVPGVQLTLRGKATEAGAIGDTVGILNPQTKKVLQAVVIGPGRVSVAPGAAPTGRLASAGGEP